MTTRDDGKKNPVLIVPTAPIKILLLFIYNSCMVNSSTSCVWTPAEVMNRDYIYTILYVQNQPQSVFVLMR